MRVQNALASSNRFNVSIDSAVAPHTGHFHLSPEKDIDLFLVRTYFAIEARIGSIFLPCDEFIKDKQYQSFILLAATLRLMIMFDAA